MSVPITTRILPGGGVIEDDRDRAEKMGTEWFAIGTDSYLSGWGQAPRRSLYALPCRDFKEAELCAENLKKRGDMKRVRIVAGDWRPRLRSGDHLHIASRFGADRHYRSGGF